jgi:DNA-damage-inducible protein J
MRLNNEPINVATYELRYWLTVEYNMATSAAFLKTTDVRSRIDEHLKTEAASVLNDCGLTISSAIRLFLEQVVQAQGVPFEIKRKRPSSRMALALEEAKLIEKQFSSLDEMMQELSNSESRTAKQESKAS